ncbi:L-2-hydroxyglutarate oxidase [Pseudactinotalea sp. HY158]|uniref:L-2-hydroxyglutarate oxidase n=1 Tax=Pseudactinotalea sp. HY158 TaxID=2654547 RepID=UPI001E4CA9DC|nr:L-2-hydroxyglutarate oxidase [Pseudactinotalea sp. HY158]
MQADVCIVGGGIVGLATAHAVLGHDPGARIVVLEKERSVAAHQSGHNSGVVHSGVYYPPGSLKSRFCLAGARATEEFARAHGVPMRRCGKHIVAVDAAEVAGLEELAANAAAIGLPHELIDGAELRRREPALVGVCALHIPSTGILDYGLLTRRLAMDLVRRGVRLVLGVEVTAVDERPGRVEVVAGSGTGRRRIEAGRLLACAGLQSDRLARLAGLDPGVRIVPFRGEYHRLAGPPLARSLIYPVPDPQLPFLGVHISPLIGGGTSVGPSAVLGRAREGYGKASVNLRDIADYLTYPGLWHLAARHLHVGWDEARGSASKHAYAARVRRYAPSLRTADLRPFPAGIRAQALRPDGRLVEDFLLARTERMVHVLNAPSPAATAAFPIGEHLAGLAGLAGSADPADPADPADATHPAEFTRPTDSTHPTG